MKERVLTTAEIRGLLRIASIRPDKTKVLIDDLAAATRPDFAKRLLNSLTLAIEMGRPDMFLPNTTRAVAKNWA